MADLLSAEHLEAIEETLEGAPEFVELSRDTAHNLVHTALAYHVQATDPTGLRDQLAAQLAGVAEVVAKHHRDLMAQDELPEYLVDRLVENLHTTLLTAGGGA